VTDGVVLFLTPSTLVAGAIAGALNIYALSGGADFGGGSWDLLASGPRRDQQRALVSNAISPIWEANHVWLILVVVLLFTAFPPVFARLMTLLHIPLTLMLLGIVLRGSAFTFRSYDSKRDSVQRAWGRVFALASTGTPFLLGIIVGSIGTGALAPNRLALGRPFVQSYLWPWLAPFPIGVGVLALCLFAFLAAVYLTVEAGAGPLQSDFRARALWASAAVAVSASADLLLARSDAPLVWAALTTGNFAMALRVCAALSWVAATIALWRGSYRAARIAAVIEVSLIIWGWAWGQYPFLVPPDLTVENAAAPVATLRLLLGALSVGLALLIPSLRYLFKVFKTVTDR
jgi:cytochrome d ubiquinol oxidase subunit II